MNYENSLQASFWLMVVMQTIGLVDPPTKGPRKMPQPGGYLAIIIVWGVLQLVADAGFAKAAQAAGWVMALVGAVQGPFGARIIGLFQTVTTSTEQGLQGSNPQGTVPAGSATTGVI